MASAEVSNEEPDIQDLPDEILEYILSLTSPYRDFKSAMMVCKRWRKVMESKHIINLFTIFCNYHCIIFGIYMAG